MDVTPIPHSSPIATFWLWFRFVLFFGMHVAVLVAAWLTPLTAGWLALCAASFVIRSFGVSAGYHRYFAHKSFKTSRAFQFFLAVLAQSSNQNGVLWWAARHRHHHAHADEPADVHSPVQHGFVRAHLTWFMVPSAWPVDEKWVRDWLSYPELVWLQRLPFLPTLTLAIVLFATLGLPGLVWGHIVPTVLLLHATFTINSLSHMIGDRPYATPDRSGNNYFLALITLGEGWHNNHHHRPGSAMFGWRWYQLDLTWRGLWLLEKMGLIWDMRVQREPEAAAVG